ncbi:MAG: hypothetical protein M1451_06370, partial [Acidobacteria bacterium]|nr:hypothetical protein [Acidobacteriota bacterium]
GSWDCDGQLSVRDMFTPEQRQEMEKIREEFRSPGMQRGPGPGGMMGPRPMGPPKAPPAQNPPPADDGR